MKKIDLEQGTEEWHKFRSNGIGASECAAIFGKCPYNTPYQLWEKKLGLVETEENFAMRRGSKMEPEVRAIVEDMYENEFPPICAIHNKYNFLRASFDGYSHQLDIILEIKCVKKELHEMAKQGIVPEHYMYQVQQQLLVSGADKAIYASFNEDLAIVDVEPDIQLHKEIIEKVGDFWEKICLRIEPELSEKDKIFLENEELVSLIQEKKLIDQEMKALKEKNEEIGNKLKKYADGKSYYGNGYSVTRFYKKGSVDYSSIKELENVNLDLYRKPGAFQWRINV
ncbi:MAG TPA: YqaJ viral recombinase family protein [Patescibacteria group bacterium]